MSIVEKRSQPPKMNGAVQYWIQCHEVIYGRYITTWILWNMYGFFDLIRMCIVDGKVTIRYCGEAIVKELTRRQPILRIGIVVITQ
jgi:hypothetical protein